MRFRTILLIATVAIMAALLLLFLLRPTVTAPTGSPRQTSPDAAASADPVVGPVLSLPRLDPVPWDAVEWHLVPDAIGPADVLRRVEGMLDAGDRLIAWGRAPQPERNQFHDMGAVFVSADGRDWREIPVDHGVNAASTSTIVSVAAGPLGYLAVGSVCCEPETVAAWHSADAITWRRLDLDGAIGGYLNAAVGLEDGWLVLGTSRDASAGTIWFSGDARSWEPALEVTGGRFAPGLVDLDRTPIGIVAVGTVVAPDGSYDGGVWRSADGRTWDRIGANDPALAGEGEAQPSRVIGHGAGLLLTGIFGTAEQRQQCEELLGMVGSIDPVPPGPPPHDATSCMSGSEHVWASSDGTEWERVDVREATGQLQPIEFRVVAAGGPGLVLLGETGRPASPDTTLFTSADGVAWTAVEPPAPVGPEVAIALAVRGRELIALSEQWDGAASSIHVRTGTVHP